MVESENMRNRPHLIPALIAAGLLLGAIAPLPYGYYQMLRWVVGGIAIYMAYKSYSWEKRWATWIFGIVAVLFNPVVPIHLTKEIWQPIDGVCAVFFGSSILFLKEPTKEVNSGG